MCSAFTRFNHLFVYFLLCVGRAGKGCIAAEILICHRLHGDHVEFVGHAVACDHGAGKLCGLLNVVGGAGRYAAENDLLRCAAAREGGDLVMQLLLVS